MSRGSDGGPIGGPEFCVEPECARAQSRLWTVRARVWRVSVQRWQGKISNLSQKWVLWLSDIVCGFWHEQSIVGVSRGPPRKGCLVASYVPTVGGQGAGLHAAQLSEESWAKELVGQKKLGRKSGAKKVGQPGHSELEHFGGASETVLA